MVVFDALLSCRCFAAGERGVFSFSILQIRNYKLAALLALTFVVIGCRAEKVSPTVAETREVKDDLGRSIKVPVRIDRAVSLAPSLTESVFAVGAGDKLVGVTTYCNYPAETSAIDKVGDTQTPNIEKIIAVRPQVVLVSTASQLEAFYRTLDEQGIAVFVTNPADLEGVLTNLAQLGDLFGTQNEASAKVNSLRERIAKVDAMVAGRPKSRVFVQISKSPLFTIGKSSFLTEIVDRAGGDSVTKEVEKAYPEFSKETALALNPDAIVLSESDDNREPNDVFNNSAAVKSGRVFRINADLLSRPSPRVVDALEKIAAALHGDKSGG